jgi:hypothetical protein
MNNARLGMMTLTLRGASEADVAAAAAAIRGLPEVVRVRCLPGQLAMEITYRAPAETLLRDIHHALRQVRSVVTPPAI